MITYIKSFSPFVYKYTYCLLIDMIVLWIITGVSFLLAGLEYPFMFATIIAISDLIPYNTPNYEQVLQEEAEKFADKELEPVLKRYKQNVIPSIIWEWHFLF